MVLSLRQIDIDFQSGSAKKKILRADLEPHVAQMFEELKKERAIQSNAEMLRLIITEAYRSQNIILPEKIFMKIVELLENPIIENEVGIYSVQDFVIRACEYYLKKLRKNIGTLYDWRIRKRLNDAEKEVAVIIIELQTKDTYKWGVTPEDVKKQCDLDVETIKKIFARFERNHWLEKTTYKGKTYYYAPMP